MRDYLTLILLFICLAVSAQNRSLSTKESIAYHLLFPASTRAASTITDKSLKVYTEAENYSIIGNDKRGFVVLSNDVNLKPVLGVSFTPYREGQMPCGFQWWLATISKSISKGYAREAQFKGLPTRASSSVSHFVTTIWGQDAPFNNYTPKVNGQHAPTGCVATAMSQIMKYYAYPVKGKGTGFYSYGSKNRTSVISTTYNWNNMLDDYTSGGNSLQNTAVAFLMRDAGYASQMNYDTDGSGTTGYQAAQAFCNNFSYDSLALQLSTKVLYSNDEWMDMIYKELDAKHPILYMGADSTAGGHAFVFDGYDADGKVYVNWGWDGTANGYYDVADLAPEGQGYNFKYSQSMLTGIRRDGVDKTAAYHSQWISSSPLALHRAVNDCLEVDVPDFYNIDFKTFQGSLYLLMVSSNKVDTISYELLNTVKDSVGAVSYGYGFSNQDQKGNIYPMTFPTNDIPAGKYSVLLASQAVQEKTVTPFRYPGGTYSATFTKAADGSVTVEGETTAIKKISSDKVDSDAPMKVYDINGVSVPSSALSNSYGHKVLVVRQGSKSYKIIK